MSHCSHCYHRFNHSGFNIGHWWNNDPYLAKVCSVECKDKLWKMMHDGTWMDHKPEAIFGKKKHKPSPNFDGPQSITDKQFTAKI